MENHVHEPVLDIGVEPVSRTKGSSPICTPVIGLQKPTGFARPIGKAQGEMSVSFPQ